MDGWRRSNDRIYEIMGRWKVSEQRNEVIKTALLEDQSAYTHVPQTLLLRGISLNFVYFLGV